MLISSFTNNLLGWPLLFFPSNFQPQHLGF